MDSGPLTTSDVLRDAISKATIAKGCLRLLFVKLQSPAHREQVVVREALASGQQQRVRLPELPVHRGELGKLRREAGARVKL